MTDNRVAVLVPSYRRPAQLQCMIESLAHNLPRGKRAVPVDVIAVCRDCPDEYARVQRETQAALPAGSKVVIKRESNFYNDVYGAVNNAFYRFFIMAVDDTIWCNDVPLHEAVRVLDERPDVMAYSFRLSPRTRTCYMHHDKAQRYAPVGTLHGQVLHRYGDATLDYAYWCDISSSMFRQSDLARMVQANKFYNPTTLEHYVWLWGRTDEGRPLLKRRPLLASAPDVSCAFSAPVNIVQSTAAGNRGGARRDYSGAALLEAYRAGKRIRIEPFQGMRPEAVHVEVDLRFR